MSSFTLFQYPSCPFCYRVSSVLRTLDLQVEVRDIHRDKSAMAELVASQGRSTVPVLKIVDDDGTERWMAESADIIQYLRQV